MTLTIPIMVQLYLFFIIVCIFELTFYNNSYIDLLIDEKHSFSLWMKKNWYKRA